MIQRIQSIYLLLVGVLMIATVFSPLFAVSISGAELDFTSFGIFTKQVVYPAWGIVSLAAVCAVLPLINIFLYKKRKTQIKITTITSLLILFFYITVGVYFYFMSGKFDASFINVQYGIFLPLIAIIFNTLAARKIKKDENLVRSLDRIR